MTLTRKQYINARKAILMSDFICTLARQACHLLFAPVSASMCLPWPRPFQIVLCLLVSLYICRVSLDPPCRPFCCVLNCRTSGPRLHYLSLFLCNSPALFLPRHATLHCALSVPPRCAVSSCG